MKTGKLRILALVLLIAVSLTACGNGRQRDINTDKPPILESEISETSGVSEPTGGERALKDMTAEEIAQTLTLRQKAAQMLQPAVYNVSVDDMKQECYGSILSTFNQTTGYKEWQAAVKRFQEAALASEAGIPYIYGQDDVHGVNYCHGAVLFPHNVGIGAANDPELTYQMGLATADEAKLCHMLWNFAPCVAQAADPRWGRTYESYSADLDIITSLSTSYVKGLVEGGIVACPKHFFADGNAVYGTGEDSDVDRLIDRGDARLSEAEISALLSVYEALVKAGAQTVMISHSSLNGVKMHENGEYIGYLKNELGFDGYIISDWNSVNNITGTDLKEKMIKSVNAGIDMFMQVDAFGACMEYIIEGVNEGLILQERVDDAVTRILRVKKDIGLFDDPYCQNIVTKQEETGSDEYRALAEKLVEKSLVLMKNEGNILPLKKGIKVYLTGPAGDNMRAQCGGWTGGWEGSDVLKGVTTIKKGLSDVAPEFDIEIITDAERAGEADVCLLVVGERAYAEWNGDTADLSLTGALGLGGNTEAIEEAERLGIPTVACIIAGRNVIIEPYYDQWDAVVMCYLPGSEGQGVANVLTGKSGFSGKLAMPWYDSVDNIGTDKIWRDIGFGESY